MPIYRYQFSGVPDSLENLGQFLPTIPLSVEAGPATIIDIEIAAASKADLDDVMARKGYDYLTQDPPDSASAASAILTLSRVTLYNGGISLAKRGGVNFVGSAQATDELVNDRVSINAAAIGSAMPMDMGQLPVVGVSGFASREDHVHRGSILQSQQAEITVDVTTTSTVFVPFLSMGITTQAGSVLRIDAAGALSNSNAGSANFVRLLVDGVPIRASGMRSNVAGSAQGVGFTRRVAGLTAGAHTVSFEWRCTNFTAQCRPVAAPDQESFTAILWETLA